MTNYFVVKFTGSFGFIRPWTALRDDIIYSQQFLTPSIIEGIRLKLGIEGKIIGHRLRYAGMDLQLERTQQRFKEKFEKFQNPTAFTETLVIQTDYHPINNIPKTKKKREDGQPVSRYSKLFETPLGQKEMGYSILMRGILLNPELHLAFESSSDAEIAAAQHICLCRNEDILLPASFNEAAHEDVFIQEMNAEAWLELPGFELIFGKSPNSFLVGYNRYLNEKGEKIQVHDKSNQPMEGSLNITGNPIIAYESKEN